MTVSELINLLSEWDDQSTEVVVITDQQEIIHIIDADYISQINKVILYLGD